jgi:hypothetical protein
VLGATCVCYSCNLSVRLQLSLGSGKTVLGGQTFWDILFMHKVLQMTVSLHRALCRCVDKHCGEDFVARTRSCTVHLFLMACIFFADGITSFIFTKNYVAD